jgi:hypothetical protein
MPKIRDVRKLFQFATRQPAVRVVYDLESEYQQPWDVSGRLIRANIERSPNYPFRFSIGLKFEQIDEYCCAYGLLDFSRYWNGLIGESDLGSLAKLHVIEPGKPLFWTNWHSLSDQQRLFIQYETISREMESFLKSR